MKFIQPFYGLDCPAQIHEREYKLYIRNTELYSPSFGILTVLRILDRFIS